jgi:hypothetical protein
LAVSETKLTGILESIKPYPSMITGIVRLNGEAFFQSNAIDSLSNWLLTNRRRLGIKKRIKNTHSTFKSAAVEPIQEEKEQDNTLPKVLDFYSNSARKCGKE